MKGKWFNVFRAGRTSIPLVMAVGGAVLGSFIGGIYYGVAAQMALTSLGFMAGSVLGSILFPQESKIDMPKIASYPIQQSGKGTPVPIIYGTCKVAGNIVWMGPVHPYVIRHTQSVGGKGGGGTVTSTETRYRKSFLIVICHGPATVCRAWKGKKEISVTDFTWFRGHDNSGINALTGEDYSDYKNLCCAFFDEYELGNSESLPNFTFEISTTQARWDSVYISNNGHMDIRDSDHNLVQHTALSTAGNIRHAVNPFTGEVACGMNKKVAKFDADWNLDESYYIPTGGWPVTMDVVWGMEYSRDGKYLYVHIKSPDRIYKFNVATGVEVTQVNTGWSLDLVIDWSGNVYCGKTGAGDYAVQEHDKDLVFVADFINFQGLTRGLWIDRSHNKIIGVGVTSTVWHPNYYQIGVQDLSTPAAVFPKVSIGNSGVILVGVVAKGDYIYAVGARTQNGVGGAWACIYKYDFSLNLIDSYDTGWTAYQIWLDYKGDIVVYARVSAIGTFHYYTFDENLTLLEQSGNIIDAISYAPTKTAIPVSIAMAPCEADENPAHIIKDLLTNTRYGAGIDSSYIDNTSFNEIEEYCGSEQMLISLAVNEQRPVLDWVDYVCSHFQGYIYMTEGTIHLGCFRSQSSQFTITQDNFVSERGEGVSPPVKVRKRLYTDTFNKVEVTWTNRAKGYDTSVAVANDEVDQRVAGEVRKKTIQLAGITNSTLAQKMVYRILYESLYRFSIYTFTVSYKNMLLRVGDVGTLSDGGLIVSQPIRIVSIEEDKDGRGLGVEAVEDLAYLYVATGYTSQDTEHEEDPDPVLVDGDCAFRENQTTQLLYLSMVPGGADTNGWFVYRSYDDVSYDFVGRANIDGVTSGDANSHGTLNSNLPSHPSVCYQGEESFEVDIGTVTDLDTAVTDVQFFNDHKLAKIGNEIIAYKTCEETTVAGVWRVTGLIRGLFNTEAVAHSVGEDFYTLDIDFIYVYEEADIGKTIYFKLLTFYGDTIQQLDEVSGISHLVRGEYKRPAPASLIRLTSDENEDGSSLYRGTTFELYWNLASKVSGFNAGGFDLDEDGKTEWRYGDDEVDLINSNGVLYGSYTQDPELEAVDLIFYENDGTRIGERTIAVAETETITLTTDLSSEDPARVAVLPRRTLRTSRENYKTVDQI